MGFAMNELSEVVSRSQICSRVLQCVEVRCSVLQRVAVRCSVSQCDAVCCADYLLYRALILQTEESAAFKYVAVRCADYFAGALKSQDTDEGIGSSQVCHNILQRVAVTMLQHVAV